MRHYVWEPGKSHLERLCSLLRQTTSFIITTLWNTILQKSGENVWHGNVFRGLNPKRSSPTNHKVASVISRSDGCFLLGCHIRQWCHQSVSWTLVRRFSEGLEGSIIVRDKLPWKSFRRLPNGTLRFLGRLRESVKLEKRKIEAEEGGAADTTVCLHHHI